MHIIILMFIGFALLEVKQSAAYNTSHKKSCLIINGMESEVTRANREFPSAPLN